MLIQFFLIHIQFPSVKIEWEKCTDIPSAASNLCVVSMYDAVYVGSGQSDEHVIKT